MMRISTVPHVGCRRTSHHRYVWSWSASESMSSSTDRTQSAYDEKTRGMPTRGNAWNSGVRALARPVSRPCQNGELADSASSSGRCARIWFSAASAPAGVGHADVDVQREGRLAPGERAHRAVDGLVALGGGDLHVVPDRERVRARARGAQAQRPQHVAQARRAARASSLASRSATVRWIAGAAARSPRCGSPSSSARAGRRAARASTSSIACASDQLPGAAA